MFLRFCIIALKKNTPCFKNEETCDMSENAE